MNKPRILVFAEDLYAQLLIQKIAEAKQLDIHFARPGEQLFQEIKTLRPFMMIVDMRGFDTGWLFKHIADIKGIKPEFPIVAFVDTDEEALRRRLESAGCGTIITKEELYEKLPAEVEKMLGMGK